MRKVKIPTLLQRSGDGRSVMLQEHDDGKITLAFRRPIEREHVAYGQLIQPPVVTRDGTKRVLAIALDDTSAEAVYLLLKQRREERMQMALMLSVAKRLYATCIGERSFLSRFMGR